MGEGVSGIFRNGNLRTMVTVGSNLEAIEPLGTEGGKRKIKTTLVLLGLH